MTSNGAKTKKKYSCWFLNDDCSDSDETANAVEFSPCGLMIAVVVHHCVRVLRLTVVNLEVHRAETSRYSSDHIIDMVKWSTDSKSLAAVSFEQNTVVVINPHTGKKLLSISEGKDFPLEHVLWSPDNHIFTSLKHSISSKVYSLSGECHIFPNIAMSFQGSPSVFFSPNGLYVAIIQFIVCGYQLVVFSMLSWKLLWRNKLNGPAVSGLLWSKNSLLIAVWFHSVDLYIQIFEVAGWSCQPLKYFGDAVTEVEGVEFSPCSKLLAVKCSDQKKSIVYLYNLLTWQLASVLDHCSMVKENLSKIQKLIDCSKEKNLTSQNYLEVALAFSSCGRFLAVPSICGDVHVWSINKNCSLYSVLCGGSSISDLRWHPSKAFLAVTLMSSNVIIWKISEGKSHSQGITNFPLTKLKPPFSVQWSGKNLLLSPKGQSTPKIAVALIKK